MQPNLKKGQIIIVKVPPFFEQEYFYEITAAGGRVIRASLYHSPRVKKHWTLEEYALLQEHGIVRVADKGDLEHLAALDAATDAAAKNRERDEDESV